MERPPYETASVERVPFGVAAGWGLGAVVSATLLYVSNTLLLRYLTDEVGIAATMAGVMIAASKVYDAISDPIVGALSDRTRSRWGRRRPFLLIGTLACAVSLVMLFSIPAFDSSWVTHGYVMLQLLVFAMAYTIFNVPYLAMPAEMTGDTHQRSVLTAYRVYGSFAAMLLAGSAGPLLLDTYGGGRMSYSLMALTLAIPIIAAGALCLYATRSARFTEGPASSSKGLGHDITLIVQNRPLLWLLVLKVALLAGSTASACTVAYFTKLVLKLPDASLGKLMLLQTLGSMASIPVWLSLGRRLGKRACYTFGALLFAGASLSWAMADAAESWPAVVARFVLLGAGSGCLFLMSYSLLPDVMEHDYVRTGLRREGTIAAVYTFFEKIAHAAAASGVGLILGAMGYVAATGRVVEQPETALRGVTLCYGILPGLLVLLSAAAVWRVRFGVRSS